MNPYISQHIKSFRSKKNILSLFWVLALVIRQGRIIEVIYGLYCFVFYRPSTVFGEDLNLEKSRILALIDKTRHEKRLFIYSEKSGANIYNALAPGNVPRDFRVRRNSVVQGNDWLLLGEYAANSGRLYFVTEGHCQLINCYSEENGVCHIHCIHKYGKNQYGNDMVLVTTGDSVKALDLWVVNGDEITFSKRIMKHFAGFTASAEVNGEHYFGTDFTNRPNYIYRLGDKKKFSFPKHAFKKYAERFDVLDNRYIVSKNINLDVFGGQAISVFDTKAEKFIYSEVI